MRPGCLRGQWDRDALDGSGEQYFKPAAAAGGGRGAAHYERRLLQITRRFSAESVVYYRGGLVAGLRHGLGTALHLDGSHYTGEWVHGNMCGWGRMLYPGGMSYEGPFVDNARHGLGVLSCPPSGGGAAPLPLDPLALHGATDDPEDIFATLFPALPTEGEPVDATGSGQGPGGPAAGAPTGGGGGGAPLPPMWDFSAGPWEVEVVLETCRDMPFHAPDSAGATTSESVDGWCLRSGVDCCCYRGEFRHDVAEGRGIIELRSGQVWEGVMINGSTMSTAEDEDGDY